MEAYRALSPEPIPSAPLAQMTHAEKVTEIMTPIGAAPSDFDRARRKFDSLKADEINGRLSRLRAGEDRITEWRANRGTAHSAAPT
jgi:hypothetical protein